MRHEDWVRFYSSTLIGVVWGIQTLKTMIYSCKRVAQDLVTSTPEHFLFFAHSETVYNPYTWSSFVDHCQILHEFHTHVRSILQSSSCMVLPSQIHTCHQKLIGHHQYCPQHHVQLPIANNLHKLMVCHHHIQEYMSDYLYLLVMAYAEVTAADYICHCSFCKTFIDIRISSPYWGVYICKRRHYNCHCCRPQNNVCHFAHCFYNHLCCFDKTLVELMKYCMSSKINILEVF